ncbi:MAG: hypothetical protein NZ519_13850, partial [Bacteroidia bacterium]|nr:hypothetical protein [Bacteroidia bacterium]
MPTVEFNEVTGPPKLVYETLNRKIGAYKARYSILKIGITGRNPQQRFNEHLQSFRWKRMVVIYKTRSIKVANMIEEWLVERHYDDIINSRRGGGSYLSP